MTGTAPQGIYGVGGLSFVITGLLFLVAFLTLVVSPGFFDTGETALKGIAQQKILWVTQNLMFGLGPIFLIPGLLALYFALRELGKIHMVIATGLWALSIGLNTVLTTLTLGVLRLSNEYVATNNEVRRAALAAAADLVLGVGDFGFPVLTALFALAIILNSLVMLRGIFSKRLAYVGIGSGIMGVISVVIPAPGLFILGFIFGVALILWLLASGAKLYKLG